MSGTVKVILSAVLAAVIAGGGVFLGVATDLGPDLGLGDIKSLTWVVIAVTAVIAGAKDLRTYLAKPPEMPSRSG